MAQYKYTYHNLLEFTDGTLEAKSKADALKQLRQQISPMCKPKVFATKVRVERVKVVKSIGFNCAVCTTVVPRSEFVSHVRGQHGQ